jgi:hypothetical protein
VVTQDHRRTSTTERRPGVTFDAPRRPGHTRRGLTLLASTNYLTDVMRLGCGVAGLGAEDCWRRVREDVFRDRPLPPVGDAVFDIDVSTLDPDWALPRIGNPAALGVRFLAWDTRPMD